MLDPSQPLTSGEFLQWGNPQDPTYYEYMASYSPYDNVTAQPYPNVYIYTGLNDDQVPYWQPTKWVAKLRAHKTDDNIVILRTNLGAGHGGASGRYEGYEEWAFYDAYLLLQLGMLDVQPLDDPLGRGGGRLRLLNVATNRQGVARRSHW